MIADSIRRAALCWPALISLAVRGSFEVGIAYAMLESRELGQYLYDASDTERRTFWLIVAEALS